MGFFDKALSVAKNVGSQAINTATTAGSELGTAAKDSAAISALKMELAGIEEELNAAYLQIGRKYVEFVVISGEMPGINVVDILKGMDPKMTRKAEIEKEIIQIEKKMKDGELLREKQKVEEDFLQEKSKLDKALGMELLSKEEYDARISIARKRVDNFEKIRKIEQQCEFGIINSAERDIMIKKLLS